jgi:phage protein D/phage gp45-like
MPTQVNDVVSVFYVKVAGAYIREEIMQAITEIVVDQHALLPGMFTLRLLDPTLKLIDSGPFDLTKEIEIGAEREDDQKFVLMKGEITALEPDFKEGMIAELVVRGYDKSHRLYRETKSMAFLNVKDSDLARTVARAASLQPQVDNTSIVYPHVFQHNQSDLSFLMQRAWRIGYECFVEEGKLYFRKPPASGPAVRLAWGGDLQYFRPRMTLAEQVDEVIVRGWDVDQKKPIVGKANRGNLYPAVGESKNGASWASSFGRGKKVIVEQPVINQSEANNLAAARLDELSGAFIDAEGMAFRRPDIRAGKYVELTELGGRFSGKYLVTSATHVYTPDGLKTYFKVSGSRSGLLSEHIGQQQPLDSWPGLVTAVVTNTNDPKNICRVKLKFPWMTEDAESDWARVLGAGAGNGYGLVFTPAVGDEVMVAFLHGDFSQPVVVGGVWNGKDKLPEEVLAVPANVRPKVRTWHSLLGHRITMYDDDTKKIEIFTADGTRSVTLDDANKKIIIHTQGVDIILEDRNMTIEAKGDITIKASANLKIEAGANLEIKAGANADLKASGQANIKGAMVNIN